MRTVCIAVLAVLLAVTVGCCFFAVKKKSEYSAAILRKPHPHTESTPAPDVLLIFAIPEPPSDSASDVPRRFSHCRLPENNT